MIKYMTMRYNLYNKMVIKFARLCKIASDKKTEESS